MRVLVLPTWSLLLVLLHTATNTNAFSTTRMTQGMNPFPITAKTARTTETVSTATSLFGQWADDYDSSSSSSPEDALSRNKARTDVRNFLTQRAIQAFVFLLEQCRDGHTASWIEDAVECKNMRNFHGTGAFNITKFPEWDTILNDMVTRPKETLVLRVQRRSQRRKGWASNNYLNNMGGGGGASGTTSVTPPSNTEKKPPHKSPYRNGSGLSNGSYLDQLGAKASSASSASGDGEKSQKKAEPGPANKKHRKGLAGNNYLEALNAGVASTPFIKSSSTDPKSNKTPRKKNPHMEDLFIDFEIDIDPASLVTRIITVREQIANEWKQDLKTLIQTNDEVLKSYNEVQKEAQAQADEDEDDEDEDEDMADSDEEEDVEEEEEKEDPIDLMTAPYSSSTGAPEEPVIVFDRKAMTMLTNSMGSQDRDSSPLRRSNFDLLVQLSTQESIHRVMRSYLVQDRVETLAWLRDFYISRVNTFFDGDQRGYGRGDDFLEELLLTPPSIIQNGNEVHLVDPLRMTEEIIRERSAVARDWMEIVKQTPSDHTDLRRYLLGQTMAKTMLDNTESHSRSKSDSNASGSSSSRSVPTEAKSKAEKLSMNLFEAGGFE